MDNGPLFLSLADRRIAYQQRRAIATPTPSKGVIFLGGFASDMTGTKACFLDQMAARHGFGLTRFDYRGHGLSSGCFEDGCIGDWLDDALCVLDQLTVGPQILVGSSMGGWIGLLLARLRPERLAGFVGIAAAPDFTRDLIRPLLTPEQSARLAAGGSITDPAAPEDHQPPITAKLMDEAENHMVFDAPLTLNAPLHLIQGQQDRDVPWAHATKILNHVTAPSACLTLVKDGDHRLSRPQDLALIWQILAPLVAPDAGGNDAP